MPEFDYDAALASPGLPHCQQCGSERVRAFGDNKRRPDQSVAVLVNCRDCKATGTQMYRLTRVSEGSVDYPIRADQEARTLATGECPGCGSLPDMTPVHFNEFRLYSRNLDKTHKQSGLRPVAHATCSCDRCDRVWTQHYEYHA